MRSTGRAVDGPRGPVDGALVIRELHMDGATEEKTFAPGYGEFAAGGGGDLEAVALAVPVDAVGGAPPPELAVLTDGARASFDAAGAGRWAAASSRVDAMARPGSGPAGPTCPSCWPTRCAAAWPRWPRRSPPATRPAPARRPSGPSRPPSTSSSATGPGRGRPGPPRPVGAAAPGRRRRQGPRRRRRRRGHPPGPLGPRRPRRRPGGRGERVAPRPADRSGAAGQRDIKAAAPRSRPQQDALSAAGRFVLPLHLHHTWAAG